MKAPQSAKARVRDAMITTNTAKAAGGSTFPDAQTMLKFNSAITTCSKVPAPYLPNKAAPLAERLVKYAKNRGGNNSDTREVHRSRGAVSRRSRHHRTLAGRRWRRFMAGDCWQRSGSEPHAFCDHRSGSFVFL